MFSVYILKSLKNGSYYTGQTNDMQRRLRDHNRGKDRSSVIGMPWKLIHEEKFSSRREAITRERYLKSLKSRSRVEKIIAGWSSGSSRGS